MPSEHRRGGALEPTCGSEQISPLPAGPRSPPSTRRDSSDQVSVLQTCQTDTQDPGGTHCLCSERFPGSREVRGREPWGRGTQGHHQRQLRPCFPSLSVPSAGPHFLLSRPARNGLRPQGVRRASPRGSQPAVRSGDTAGATQGGSGRLHFTPIPHTCTPRWRVPRPPGPGALRCP